MKKERRITALGLIVDTLVTLIKIYGGLVFNSYAILTSGFYTVVNMGDNFLAYTGSILGGRRANKKEPLGYGKKQIMTYLVFGIIIVLLSVFIFLKSFFMTYSSTDIRLSILMTVVIVADLSWATFQFRNAKSIQSNMLMDASHDDFYDVLVTIVVVLFSILSNYVVIFDLLGSIFVSIILLIKGIKIICNSYVYLTGQNDKSKKIIKIIKDVIDEIEYVDYVDSNIINTKKYYKLIIELKTITDISLSDLIIQEMIIKEKIREKNNKIKLIEFDIKV